MQVRDSLAQTNPTLAHDVSLAVAKRATDVLKDQGDAAVSMLEDAAQLMQQMAAQSGKGMHLDVTA